MNVASQLHSLNKALQTNHLAPQNNRASSEVLQTNQMIREMLRANRFTERHEEGQKRQGYLVSLLDALSECLLSNNLSADDKLIKTNKIKDECILAISLRFSDGKASLLG